MRFGEVFRYELEYRVRSATTWVYALFLFLIMLWGLAATGESAAVHVNAPREIAQGIVLFGGTFGILVSAALFADAAIRDIAVGMDPLLYTTRVRTVEYLGGRFLAALTVNATLVLAFPLGHFVATLTPLFDPEAIGPFRALAYVQPMLLFVFPNLVLVGSILFTVATLTRHVIPVYLAAIAIFIGYIVAANYWSGIENPIVSALADPLGINAVLERTRYWTAAEANTQLIGFPSALVGNRILWLAIAAGVLTGLIRAFRFRHVDGGSRRRGIIEPAAEQSAPRASASAPIAVPGVPGSFGFRTSVRQTAAVARNALAEVMSGRAFLVAFVAAMALVLLWGWNVGDTVFETSTWPVTHLVISTVLAQRSMVIPFLVIAVYAGELVWKDREVGAAEIADAVPVSTGSALLGRFLALAGIILVFHAAFLLGGILLQALQGYYEFEIGLYLRWLLGLTLVGHLLLGVLAMAIHVLVNQKYIGHMLAVGACLLSVLAGPMGLPFLAVYNSGPGLVYSDMNGFGPFLGPFLWFKTYWAAWALLLSVVAVVFWIRGREAGVRNRIAAARSRLRGPVAHVAAFALSLIIALGGFIFYNTSVLNASPSPGEAGRSRAEYEQRYGRFETAPQPVLVAADLRVEIYPDAPAAEIRGTYRLVNRGSVAIDSVHVVTHADIATRTISLDRAARQVAADEERGYRIFALERGLAPGDSLGMSFEVVYRPRGFRSRGIATEVVQNGTYFDRRWLPFIGYQPAIALADPADRKRFGLAPRPAMPGPDDLEALAHNDEVRNEDLVHAEVIVGTARDQTAVFSGTLRRSWTEDGRRYFHYATELPAPFGASVLSGRYAVHEARWNDVALRVLHDPRHPRNVAAMVRSMKASLDYYTSAFGPYQYQELRVVEVPPYSVRGRALATTILFAEDFFITRAREGRFDQTFFGTAHEVAHSWWGGQLRSAHVRGRAVLSEALSNYSAMMVTEKTFGPKAAQQVYDYQMDRYLSRRASFRTDVPLIDAEDHPHIFYGKGAVAMYALRDHIGDEAVNGSLRQFLRAHANAGPPYPTSRDLVAALRTVTPDSLQYLLTDFFETVTLWEVKAERAVVEPTPAGDYRVTIDVSAKKFRTDSVGGETETQMDDLVEIGIFAPGAGEALGEPLYLQRHRIRSGKQTISIIVPREPARAGVDPHGKLMDRTRGDNVVEVKPAGARPTGASS